MLILQVHNVGVTLQSTYEVIRLVLLLVIVTCRV